MCIIIPNVYYKVLIFIPFFDNLINQLHIRLNEIQQEIMQLERFISACFRHNDDQSIINATSVYDNNSPVSIMSCSKTEILIWKKQWRTEKNTM